MDFFGRDLLTLKDYAADEINHIIDVSQNLKDSYYNSNLSKPLYNKTLGMIFQKRSTRTHISSEVAMYLLGGHALFLGKDDIQLGINETLKDTALVMCRMVSGILARVYEHSIVEELAQYSSVPVINALSNKYHPLQILADFLTIKEKIGHFRGKKLAWIGDGNNVLHSLMIACPKVGIDLAIATPKKYTPDVDVTDYARSTSNENKTSFELSNDPKLAINGANIVVTDTFVSMGQEAEKNEKMKAFNGFQINESLIDLADQKFIFMHCLPRHQEEVSDNVFYSKNSVVFDEAENRLHSSMAVFKLLLGKKD